MELDEDTFGKYVNCTLPLDEWFRVHDEVQQNGVFRERMDAGATRLAMTEDGQRLLEIHRAMSDYATRFKRILGKLHGHSGQDS